MSLDEVKDGQVPSKPWRWLRRAVAGLMALAMLPMAAVAAQEQSEGPAQREVQIASGAFTRGAPLPDWVEPIAIPGTQRREASVILLADTQLRAAGKPVYYANRAILINDRSALQQVGQYPIYFVPDYQRLQLHVVEVIRGGKSIDQTATVPIRFLQRETGLESGVYSGTTTASLLLADLRVGDTVHIAYSVEGANPVFGPVYAETASWDQDSPVEWRRVSLLHERARPVQWRLMGDDQRVALTPRQGERGGLRELVFEQRGLDAVEPERGVPASYLPFRFLQFTEYTSWNEVARWATGLFPPRATLPPEVEELLQKIALSTDPQERAGLALDWVQSQIRYFSVAMGESSHRPRAPAEVVRTRFGDCKDKTWLLITMLRRLGLDAQPFLLSAQMPGLPGKGLPTPEAFDHVIAQLRIGSATYYLDATRSGQGGRLSRMGQPLAGAQGLVVDASTRGLVELRATVSGDTRASELREHFVMGTLAGPATLEVRQTWNGSSAESMRALLPQLSANQVARFASSGYERRYPGIELAGAPEFKDDKQANQITGTWRFKLPRLAREEGGDWVMRFAPGNLAGVLNLPDNLRRRFPLALPAHPYHARYALTVDWPAEVAAAFDPRVQRLRSAAFDVEVTQSFRGNRATVFIDFNTLRDELAPSDLTAVSEDVRKLDRMIVGNIAVDSRMLRTDAAAAKPAALGERLRRRLAERLERQGKVIAGNQLQGEDLAGVLCEQAETRADMGDPTLGMADAERALKLAPALPRAWECRGNLQFALGRFERAIADLTKALALGADPAPVFLKRGLARYYQGRVAAAAEDFGKAAAAGGEQGSAPYAQLWQAIALQKLGKPLPGELLSRARRDPQGAWPQPALAMVAGAIDIEKMMAEVNRKTGDDLELTQAEALFFAGQQHLLQGHAAQAREAFRTVRAKDITMYTEHIAAGFELDRLK